MVTINLPTEFLAPTKGKNSKKKKKRERSLKREDLHKLTYKGTEVFLVPMSFKREIFFVLLPFGE